MPTMQTKKPCSVCKRKRGSESEIFTWQVVAIADSTVLKNYLIIQTRKCVSCAKHSQVDRKPKHRQLTHNHTVYTTSYTVLFMYIYVCVCCICGIGRNVLCDSQLSVCSIQFAQLCELWLPLWLCEYCAFNGDSTLLSR